MAKVRFVKDTEAKINDAPVTDGTIYVSSDTGKMFVDNTDERDQIGIGYTLSKSGSTITLTGEDGSVSTVTDANTTYGNATTSASGLMSASDKTKLNNLDSTISAAIGEEASARQKQDQLLEQAIDDKLGADDIIAGSNVQVNHDDASGHITISATDTKYTAGDGLTLSGTEFGIADGGIIGKYLDDNCVMERNIVVGSVTSDKIPALAITTPKLADNAVTAIKMANNAVATRSIQNGAVTADKLAEGVIPEIPEVTLASLGVTATAQELNYTDGVTSNIQTQLNGKAAVSHTHDDRYYTESETNNLLAAKANTSHTHSAANITSGTLALDRIPTITDAKIQGMSASKLTGTIPQANLPSYVDDVLEYNGKSNFPDTGESGKIYVDTSTNKTYRWSGSGYTEISASLALGTTSSTAFRGDYGNTAYQHATAKGSAFASGLYKITTNAQGHVTAATAVTKNDITALGIPAQDTNTTYGVATTSANGLMSSSDKSKLNGIDAGAEVNQNAFSNITVGSTTVAADSKTDTLTLAAGSNVTLTPDAANDKITIAATNTNTTYSLSKSGSTITLTGSDGKSTSVTDSNTTYSLGSFGVTATAAELNKLDGVTATTAEINYLDGVTSAIQTQLNGKAASSHSHPVSQVTGLTASRALISDGDGHPAVSAITSTELGYLDGVTSAIQTQLNGKAASNHTHTSLAYRGSVGETADWDTIGAGVWTVGQSAAFSATYHQPVGAYTYGTLIVNSNGSNVSQVYIAHQNGQMWFRDRFSSTNDFSAWARTYTTVSKPTAADIGAAASSHSHSTASTSAAGFLRQLNGSTSNYLRGDGTWATPPNTTYSNMSGASTSAAGKAGLVPAPAAGAANRYLRSDGTWAVPPDTNTTYTLGSFGITATAAELNKLDGCTATVTELNYLDGVTSNIQTQLNGKAASSHSHAASQITGLTASRALVSDSSGHPAVSAITSTELSYLDGVTSKIQTQLNGKAASSHTHNYAGSSSAGGAATSANRVNITTLTSQNLNDYRTPGTFFCAGGGNTCTNKPSGIDNFGMYVIQSASGWYTQILYGSDDDMYTRRWASNGWTGWVKFYSTGNKPTAADIGAAAASHNHSAANITSGTLAIARGGTGATTAADARTALGITPANIGAAASNHTHSYLPLSGGTLTGALTARGITPSADSTYDIGTSSVRYRNVYADTFTGALSGNATTASKLATARTISLSGAVSGSASFNGSGNITINTTMPSTGVGTVEVSSSQPTNSNVVLWVKP